MKTVDPAPINAIFGRRDMGFLSHTVTAPFRIKGSLFIMFREATLHPGGRSSGFRLTFSGFCLSES